MIDCSDNGETEPKLLRNLRVF